MFYSYVPESYAAHDAYDPWKVERTPFPGPVFSSRDSRCLTFPAPKPVLSLADYARENSWEVITQHSQGNFPHSATGAPGALKDVIGLRFGGHPMTDRQAYAVYSRPASGGTWTWGSVMIWGPDLPPYAGCGVTELKGYLMQCSVTSAAAMGDWVRDLKSIAANGTDLAKRRVAARRDILRMLDDNVPLAQIRAHVQDLYGPEEVSKIISSPRKSVSRESLR